MEATSIDPKIILSAIPLGKPELAPPRTHMICTIAPLNKKGELAGGEEEIDPMHTAGRMKELVEAGMSIARINLSHVTNDRQRERIFGLVEIIRKVSSDMKRPIGVMMDLCGPRLRLGKVKEGSKDPKTGERDPIRINGGQEYILTTRKEIIGDENRCSVTFESFAKDVMNHLSRKRSKNRASALMNQETYLYLDDGKLKLEVLEAGEKDVRCNVIIGGPIRSNNGINIPGVKLSTGALTKKDIQDLEWTFNRENEKRQSDETFSAVDFIALSFVKRREEVDYFKALLKAYRRNLPIVAKIETAEAVRRNNIRGILEELRGKGAVMIARGDLAIETSHEEVPALQTTLIDECRKMEIPVIVATQLLESMCENQLPLRSEVVDIVNAVREGADMVMLSRETAGGKYPVEAAKRMASILRMAERERRRFTRELLNGQRITKWDIIEFVKKGSQQKPRITTTQAIAGPACRMAESIGSPAIVICAATGTTARKCASFRPRIPIVAITRHRRTAANLLLYRGIYPILIGYQPKNIDELLKVIEGILEILQIGNEGDLVVSTFGARPDVPPLSTHGELRTNTMRIIEVKGKCDGRTNERPRQGNSARSHF